jgi:hypothetical protein
MALAHMPLYVGVVKLGDGPSTVCYVGYGLGLCNAAIQAEFDAGRADDYTIEIDVRPIFIPPPVITGPPPAVTTLNPATGPAATDITVAITGTGFDAAPTVNIGVAHSLVPASITPTDLVVLFSGAAHIQFPGVLPVSVKNSDGQVSNELDFTVT